MDLRRLGYFLSIAQHGGFAAAARARYISQSALSRQIQLLEEEIGTQLLERSSRGIRLTHAGEILRDRSAQLFQEVTHIMEDVLAEAKMPSGQLTLGMTPSMRVLLGASLIEGYLRRYPQVRLTVIEGLSHAMADAVARGLCDVAIFIRDDAKGRPIATKTLVDEPMVVCAPARVGLSMKKPVDVAWLARHPLLVSRSNRVTSGIDREAARLGLTLNVLMDVQPLHLSIELVYRGIAYMIVPFSAAQQEYEAGFLSLAPIQGFNTGWVVGWPRNRKTSAASSKLVEAIQTEFEKTRIAPSSIDTLEKKKSRRSR